MEMLCGVLLILATGSFGAPLTSSNITVSCKKFFGITHSLPVDKFAPSLLVDLKVTFYERNVLNISWAINLDNTYEFITGLEIIESAHPTLHCEYTPSLKEAKSKSLIPTTQKKMWFSYNVPMKNSDYYHVQACNLPKPPRENGFSYKSELVYPPTPRKTEPKEEVTPEDLVPPSTTSSAPDSPSLLVPVGVGLCIALGLLLVGCVTYKMLSSWLCVGYQRVASGPTVPVLVVYPAESAVFQGAVMALADFLQKNGGCSVAIDMWQQGSVAKLGPMRWLLEQVQTAHRVLIVAPQPSSQPLPQRPVGSIPPPAAAQDLYPLALNLVASRAKNVTELAKFWVIRFGDGGPLTSELQACRTFCLMKDLSKLCRCLQSTGNDNRNMKIADLVMWRANRCGGNCSEKLRAAVQALGVSVVKDQGSDKRATLMA